MARKGRWRQFVTRIALMSVFMHAIMAALMLPAPLAAQAEGAAASAICSVSPLTPGALGEDSGATGQSLPVKPCPVCDGIATSGFLLELAQTALIGRLTNPTVLRPSADPLPAGITRLAHNSRGPPPRA
jgi:hypothetical protein